MHNLHILIYHPKMNQAQGQWSIHGDGQKISKIKNKKSDLWDENKTLCFSKKKKKASP